MVQGILRVRMKIPKIEALKEFLEIKKWKPCEPEFRFYSGRDAWKPFFIPVTVIMISKSETLIFLLEKSKL